MFKIKFSYVALAAALTSTCVYADPNSYTHASGAKVIEIEKANAAGVSHNMYREFNVDKKGVILNNSTSNLNHSTFGGIAKNENLGGRSASVILNEVISNKTSTLNGFIEVAGQRAEVIVANPNGIICNGCSFVNTTAAVLTTGKVNLNENGAIKDYTVTDGKITIADKGMNTNNSFAMLLADSITINGTINASNAMLAAGGFTMDDATGNVTPSGKTANIANMIIPSHSIDISKLGGIKANSIMMVGNSAGFGVRNQGTISANGNLFMASNGSLTNEGAISNNGMVTQIAAATHFKNSGSINTNTIGSLTGGQTFDNAGTIEGQGQLVVNSNGDVLNTGKLKAVSALAVNSGRSIKNSAGASMLSDNQLVMSAQKEIVQQGTVAARDAVIQFGGESLTNHGQISGSSTLAVRSKSGESLGNGLIHNVGQINGGNLTVETNGLLSQDGRGRMESSGSLVARSNELSNYGHMGAPYLTVESGSVNNYGTIHGAASTITGTKGIHNEGSLTATYDLALRTNSESSITNRSVINAGKTLNIATKNVVNGGYKCGWFNLQTCGKGTLSAEKLVLNSTHQYSGQMGGNQYFKYVETNKVN